MGFEVMFVLVVGLIIAVALFSLGSYGATDTFEDYRAKHPDAVHKGRVHCYQCGGGSIYLRRAGNVPGRVFNTHVCRQCGTTLYRSSSSGM